MGFGSKELRRLRYAIGEIAEENKPLFIGSSNNNNNNNYVVNKFLEDIDNDYDKIFGFKPKIDQLKEQVKTQNDFRILLQQSIKTLSHVWVPMAKVLDLLTSRPNLVDSILESNIECSESPANSGSTKVSESNIEIDKAEHLTTSPSQFKSVCWSEILVIDL